jgi:hypothetical protein
MRKFCFALSLVLATPVFAQEVDPARSDLLMQLIRDNGCQMTDVEAGEILPEHGFDKSETRDIIRLWRKEGKLEMAGALALILSEEACTAG